MINEDVVTVTSCDKELIAEKFSNISLSGTSPVGPKIVIG